MNVAKLQQGFNSKFISIENGSTCGCEKATKIQKKETLNQNIFL